MERSADTDLDSGGTLAAVDEAVRTRRAAEVALLHHAAHWADLHGDHEGVTRNHGTTDGRDEKREHPQFGRFGGEGTPVVHEFATVELGVSLRVHPRSARFWMADALDLRHRLTPLWELTFTDAPFEVWVLRKIAARTRHLSQEDAGLVAADFATLVPSMPPRRLLERLDSLLILADARSDEDERIQQLDLRFVTFNTSDQRGLKGLYAKLSAADAVVGEAQVQRLAQILLAQDLASGVRRADLDPMGVARARALGLLLADPEAALLLVRRGAVDADGAGRDDPDQSRPGQDDPDQDAHNDVVPLRSETGQLDRGATAERGARVSAVLHLHLSEDALQGSASSTMRDGSRFAPGVGRLEGHGPLNLQESLELLGLTDVTIRPVLDPAETAPADSYAFTGNLREAVLARTPADIYPYATSTTHRMDLDHTIPHGAGGQTSLANAGPMTRHHHRIKTHGPMAVRQPLPDIYVWRTLHERYLLTDHTGTHDLDPAIGAGLFSRDPHEQCLSRHLLTLERLGLLGIDAEAA